MLQLLSEFTIKEAFFEFTIQQLENSRVKVDGGAKKMQAVAFVVLKVPLEKPRLLIEPISKPVTAMSDGAADVLVYCVGKFRELVCLRYSY